YTYDELSRVTQRIVCNKDEGTSEEEVFTYDGAGNITVDPENSGSLYDTNNRLIFCNETAVTYDADGNMLSVNINGENRSFVYDSANRLLSAGSHTYTYNAEDLRIRAVRNTVETTYTYNPHARLSQLLMKTLGNEVTKYVYGLGLIGEEVGAVYRTYHFDYRGSTVALTDATGTITDTFEYDTYGKVASRTGTTTTPFLYNGRDGVMTESNGLYYMRARYYSPDLRRFINADIIPGELSNAVTLNRYAYANANPAMLIDPLGLSADGETLDILQYLSIDDLQKFAEIYQGFGYGGLNLSELTIESLYSYMKYAIQNSPRPNNIGKGLHDKQIAADLKWLDDVLGPTSKLAKVKEKCSSGLLDVLGIVLDVGVGWIENVQNGENSKEIFSDAVIDASLGAAEVGASTLTSIYVNSMITGTALGTAVPGIGHVIGIAVGALAGITIYYFTRVKEYSFEMTLEDRIDNMW
ncbi:MAG: hypothetical protein IJ333_05680, partial [Clostridia bacterium]|nr:hypothetical protein [Clostridia bacterium]